MTDEVTVDMPRVLIVDDDTALSRALIRCLEHECVVSCVTASNGFEAFRILCHQRFALLVTDMAMADMSGAELLRRAKERWPEMRRILFTGYADSALVQADKENADAVLEKGGSIKPLCATICEMATTPRAEGTNGAPPAG